MKKQIFIFVFVLLAGISTAFANDATNVSSRVMNAFRRDFSGAQDVNWETGKDFTRATFNLGNQVMMAYYQIDGNLIAVTRNLLSTQLPINLLAEVKKNYQSYWISDLFEVATGVDSTYYITLQDADHIITLKSSGASGWTIYKKDRKV